MKMVVVLTMSRRNSDKDCSDAVLCTVHMYTMDPHCPFCYPALQVSFSRVSEDGPKAALLILSSPGLAPPAGLLPAPRQPRFDPVEAPHEDSLPVQVQPIYVISIVKYFLQRPAQLQEPTTPLTGSG